MQLPFPTKLFRTLGGAYLASCAVNLSCNAEQSEPGEATGDAVAVQPANTPPASLQTTSIPDAGLRSTAPEAQAPSAVQTRDAGPTRSTTTLRMARVETPPAEQFEVCRLTAVDGCELLYVSYLSADQELCTTLAIDNCPTYSRQGLLGVDVPFSWRLNSVRAYQVSSLATAEICGGGPAPLSAERADRVTGEISWDEDVTDSVPDELSVQLVADFSDLDPATQTAVTIDIRSRQPLSTAATCENEL